MSGLSARPTNSAMNFNPSGIMSMSTSSFRPISSVQVHPAAMFAILDHYLRRPQPQPEAEENEEEEEEEQDTQDKQGKESRPKKAKQQRVIGTLLGNRTSNTVEVKTSFAVPHLEDSDQVQVDMQYHKEMLELYLKANPNEFIVGWYSTGKQLKLDSYSALIHDYYSKDSINGQAVHLTFDTDLQDENLGVKAYYSSPLGITPRPSSTNFVPIPLTLLTSETEKPSLSLLSQQSKAQSQSQSQSQSSSSPSNPMLSDLDSLSKSLESVQDSLQRVLEHVRKVIKGEVKGDPVVGRYLMDSVGSVEDGKVGLGEMELDNLFNSHLQDVLMISYLSNVVRAQAEVSSRLQLLT